MLEQNFAHFDEDADFMESLLQGVKETGNF